MTLEQQSYSIDHYAIGLFKPEPKAPGQQEPSPREKIFYDGISAEGTIDEATLASRWGAEQIQAAKTIDDIRNFLSAKIGDSIIKSAKRVSLIVDGAILEQLGGISAEQLTKELGQNFHTPIQGITLTSSSYQHPKSLEDISLEQDPIVIAQQIATSLRNASLTENA